MATILDTIIDTKRSEVAQLRSNFSYADFERAPLFERSTISLKASLESNFGIIAEIKRKSPSAGWINQHVDISKQGLAYETSGAAAISCLTDETYFGGSIADLKQLRSTVSIPVLRKEFIIDELQLFEAKANGADVILLIAEALTKQEALQLTIMAKQLGLEVIMEFHDKQELDKINEFVDIIGVNNRNLHLQQTNIGTSLQMIDFLPKDRICISESGIKTKNELAMLANVGFNGALIGESILQQDDPATFIQTLQSTIAS